MLDRDVDCRNAFSLGKRAIYNVGTSSHAHFDDHRLRLESDVSGSVILWYYYVIISVSSKPSYFMHRQPKCHVQPIKRSELAPRSAVFPSCIAIYCESSSIIPASYQIVVVISHK